jgi:hypothetical protein
LTLVSTSGTPVAEPIPTPGQVLGKIKGGS